jgi:hypothetical protein
MFKKLAIFVVSATSILVLCGASLAQETQVKVVDEVVAQVNDGVITLSRVKRETKNIVDGYVEQGKSREEAQKMVDEKQGELIANLINEELLIQKAKELGLEKEVDEQLNQRLAQIMKDNNIKTVDALYAEMEKQGVDPKDLKETWRKQATRELVIQREVQAKIYWNTPSPELKEYYEKHKDKFTKPETVSFSELFLGFAGRDESQVRQKAKQLYDQLKTGGNFETLVKENGDRGVVSGGTGKVEDAPLSTLDKMGNIGGSLKGVRVGDYTLPIELDKMGVAILRVDARQAASNEATFDEAAVRMAITGEKAPEAQKEFMAKLRSDAYIKVSDAYRPLVNPLLFADERKGKVTN